MPDSTGFESTGRVRAYIACSMDGFIAGHGNELDWLTSPRSAERPLAAGAWAATASAGLSYVEFTADVGAMLMGRGTFDVVAGLDEWFYGEMPVFVATTRPLATTHETVTAVCGEIRDVVDAALAAAHGKNLYVDGGAVIRQCLDAGLVDDITVTIMPTILGAGLPLFAGTLRAHEMTVTDVAKYEDGMVQVQMRPAR